jgi:hypothetical protein
MSYAWERKLRPSFIAYHIPGGVEEVSEGSGYDFQPCDEGRVFFNHCSCKYLAYDVTNRC